MLREILRAFEINNSFRKTKNILYQADQELIDIENGPLISNISKSASKIQIGVPMWKRELIDISSWNNVQIAKGYEKIVVTWQGMWWELTWDDIIWDNLDEKIVREKGVKKWGSKGINVYQFDRGYKHNLQRHRFAVFPPNGEKVCRNSMRPDRYYIHVYQTKIKKADGVVCWLRSKEIAKFLNNKWRQTYYPRDRDFPNTTEKKELRLTDLGNHRKFLSRRLHGIRSNNKEGEKTRVNSVSKLGGFGMKDQMCSTTIIPDG